MKTRKQLIDLDELLQDGGGLPDVNVKSSGSGDWSRILMDAHADLTNQLSYYMDCGNERRVKRCLLKIEAICKAWRTKGQFE
jgi:hypothetical protein